MRPECKQPFTGDPSERPTLPPVASTDARYEQWIALYEACCPLEPRVLTELLTLLSKLDGLNEAERRVPIQVAIRSAVRMRLGRRSLGPWNPAGDRRDLRDELDAELDDAANYRAMERIRGEVGGG